MIGILGMLMGEFRGNLIARLIKRELSDLKSYFQELGFSYDAAKDDKGQDDYKVKVPATYGVKMAAKKSEEPA